MKDQKKAKRQLIDELAQMRQRVAELEAAGTERLEAGEAIEESEEKYRSLVESVEDSVYLVDQRGTYLFLNKKYQARLDLPEDKVIGRTYGEFHSGEKTREFTEKLKRVFETCGPVQYEHTSERDDHSFLRTLSPVRDQERQITAVTVISKDITERKQAEEALRESGNKYSTLMEEAPIGICHVGIKGTITYVNKTILQGTGYSSEELIGKNVFRLGLIPRETLKLLGRRMKEKLMGKPPSPLQIQFKRKNGKWMWLEIRGRVLSKDGVPVGVQIIGEEITQRKQAELEVRRRAAQATLAYEVGQRVRSKLELNDLLSEIVAAVCNAFDYYGVMILLVDEEAEGLTLQSIAGGYAGIFPKDLWLAIGVGMIGYSAASGQTQVSGDISKDPHYVRKAEEGTKSELAIPVKSGQKVIGVLDIQDDEFDAFDETDVMTMETLANEVGVAIENARLYEDIRKELTQRKLAEERLKESEERYRSLVEAGSQMGEAIVLLQNTDKLEAAHLFANEEWARITGYTPGELREMSYLDLVHRRYRGAVAERLRQRWQGEILPGPWEIAIVAKDGTEVPVEAAGSPVMYRDKPAVVGYVRDITERKRAEERLAHLNAVLHSIRKVNQLVTTERDRDKLLKGICVGLTETRSYFNAWIALLDDSGGYVTSFEAGLGKDFSPILERLKRGELTACGQKALAQPEPDVVVTGDPLSACGDCPLSKMYADEGGMSIRLEYAGRVYGLLSVSVPAALVTDEEERGLFKEVAEDIAFALHAIEVEEERKRAEEMLERRAEQLQIIGEVGQRVSSTLNLDELLSYVAKAVQKRFGYYHVDVFLIDEVQGYAVFEASSNPAVTKPWKERGLRFKVGEEGMPGWVAKSGEPLWANDVSRESHFFPNELMPETKSELTVPGKVENRVVGVLDVQSNELGAFDEEDLHILQTIADQLAIAIENARLFQESKSRAEEMVALSEVNLAILSTLERDRVFEILLDQLDKVLDCDTAAIKAITPEGVEKMIAGRGPIIHDQAMWDGFDVKDNRLVQEMRETRCPVVVHDTHTDERYERVGDWKTFRSWVGAPIFVRDKMIGSVVVERTTPGVYDEKTVQLLADFAHTAAIALENAGLYEDIRKELTERTRAEDEIRRLNQYLESIIDNANVWLDVLDANGNVVIWNKAAEEMCGYTREEVIEHDKIWEWLYPDEAYRKEITEGITAVVDKGEVREEMETTIRCKDGSTKIISWNERNLLDEKGSAIGSIALGRDITEQSRAQEAEKLLQAQLYHGQKMESIGTLASGIAHEINNPLMGIINYAQLIHDRIQDEKLKEFSDGIIKEGNRVGTIVKNLLSFARQEKETHSPAHISDIIEASLSLIGAVLRNDQITIEQDIPDDLPKIKCRSQQIEQVILNLLTNARDALNRRYEGYHEDKVVKISVRSFEREGEKWIRTTVEDHGTGIPQDVSDRVFDPFYSTKPKDKGTGLGLSVSYGIVKEHRGELTVESSLGDYTRFYMELRVDNEWSVKSGDSSLNPDDSAGKDDTYDSQGSDSHRKGAP